MGQWIMGTQEIYLEEYTGNMFWLYVNLRELEE